MANRPLNVLHIISDSRRSGIPALVSHLINADDTGRVNHSVLFAYSGVYTQELREAGTEVIDLGPRTTLLWRIKRFLLNYHILKNADRFDVIHVHGGMLALSVLFAKLRNAKVLLHIHELPNKVGTIYRKAMLVADCTVFCSKTAMSYFEEIPARRKALIVNAIRPEMHSLVNHNSPVLSIVMAGSINKNKGQHLLLEAFSRLKNREAKLYFYGTVGLSAKKYFRDLQSFVEAHGLSGRVFFPGPTHQLAEVFQHSTVVAHTSLKESFGIVLVEAMSHGLPVVTHNLNGMKEVVRDGVTGFLVELGDSEGLVGRIDQLLANPRLRSEMGLAGRQSVLDDYNMALRVEDFFNLYRSVCEQEKERGL